MATARSLGRIWLIPERSLPKSAGQFSGSGVQKRAWVVSILHGGVSLLKCVYEAFSEVSLAYCICRLKGSRLHHSSNIDRRKRRRQEGRIRWQACVYDTCCGRSGLLRPCLNNLKQVLKHCLCTEYVFLSRSSKFRAYFDASSGNDDHRGQLAWRAHWCL
jgi:hypothetical protein